VGASSFNADLLAGFSKDARGAVGMQVSPKASGEKIGISSLLGVGGELAAQCFDDGNGSRGQLPFAILFSNQEVGANLSATIVKVLGQERANFVDASGSKESDGKQHAIALGDEAFVKE